ncbi:unnamed protein product, partial [Allacma fusca]
SYRKKKNSGVPSAPVIQEDPELNYFEEPSSPINLEMRSFAEQENISLNSSPRHVPSERLYKVPSTSEETLFSIKGTDYASCTFKCFKISVKYVCFPNNYFLILT